MRQVVSPQEVSHLWAHRRQDYATNQGRSFWFRGDTIYSYGTHFPIARHLPNGAIAFTTSSYSISTNRHVSVVRQAIPSHKTLIFVSDVCMVAGMADRHRVQRNATALVEKAANRRSQARRDDDLADALGLAQNFNEYAEAIGSAERIDEAAYLPANVDLVALREVLRKQMEERAAVERAAEAATAVRMADSIARWKRGDMGVSSYDIRNAPTALRLSTEVRGGSHPADMQVVETSRGASIPVADARRLWPVIQRVMRGERDYEVGMELGGYQLTKIRRDGSIVVGCHDIGFSEIERIAVLLGLVETVAA